MDRCWGPWADAQRRVEWIESHPEALEEETLRVSTSGGLSPSWDRRTYQKSSIWAFLPYEALRVPTEVGNKGHHPIDAFLQQKREANGLAPAPPAKPRDLIRRMFLDLTGLLPQPEELGHWMQRWELAASPGAGHRKADRTPSGKPSLWRALGSTLVGCGSICRYRRHVQ